MTTKTTKTKAKPATKRVKAANPYDVTYKTLDQLIESVKAEHAGSTNAIEIASRLKEITFGRLVRLHVLTIWENLKHCHDATDLGVIARSFRDLACEIDGRAISYVTGYSQKTENQELEMAIGLIDFTTDGHRREMA